MVVAVSPCSDRGRLLCRGLFSRFCFWTRLSPAVGECWRETQGVVSVLSPSDYAAKIAKETKELAGAVAAANIKAE